MRILCIAWFMLGVHLTGVAAQSVHHELQLPDDKRALLEHLARQNVYTEQQGEHIHIWLPQSPLFLEHSTRLKQSAEPLLLKLKELLDQMTVPHLTITGYYDTDNQPDWKAALVRGQMESLSDALWEKRSIGSLLLMSKQGVKRNNQLAFWRNNTESVFFELSFNQGIYDL